MSGESLHTDVLLLRSGDKNAFERLYKMFWAKVYHFTSLYIKFWEIRERLLPDEPRKRPLLPGHRPVFAWRLSDYHSAN